MSLLKKVSNYSAVNLMGHGLRVSLSFLSTILASRYLGSEDFGYINVILGYTVFLNYILTLGFDNSFPRYVAKFESQGKKDLGVEVIRFGLMISGVFGLVVTAGASLALTWLSPGMIKDEHIVAICLIIFNSLFWTQGSVLSGYLRAKKIFTPVIIREQIIFPLVHCLALVFLLVVGDFGIVGFALGYFLAAMLSYLYTLSKALPHLKPVFRKDLRSRQASKTQVFSWLKFSFPLSVIASLEPVMIWVSVVMCGWYLPVNEVGYFAVCLKLTIVVQFLFMALGPVFSSYMADLYHAKEMGEFRLLYQMTNYWSAKWALLVCFILIAIPETLLGVFGQEYLAAMACLFFILPGSLIEACTGSAKQSLIMAGHNHANVFLLVLGVIVTFLANLVLIPRFGLIGAGIGFSLGFFALNISRAVYFMRIAQAKPMRSDQLLRISFLFLVSLTLGLAIRQLPVDALWKLVFAAIIFVTGTMASFWSNSSDLLEKINERRTRGLGAKAK